jgi:hypothetical protein
MDLSLKEKSWNKIVSLSNSMLELSRREQWDDLAKVEKERDDLLRAYFSKPVSALESEHIAKEIKEILVLDRETLKLCQNRQKELGTKLTQFNKCRKVNNAYRENSF